MRRGQKRYTDDVCYVRTSVLKGERKKNQAERSWGKGCSSHVSICFYGGVWS